MTTYWHWHDTPVKVWNYKYCNNRCMTYAQYKINLYTNTLNIHHDWAGLPLRHYERWHWREYIPASTNRFQSPAWRKISPVNTMGQNALFGMPWFHVDRWPLSISSVISLICRQCHTFYITQYVTWTWRRLGSICLLSEPFAIKISSVSLVHVNAWHYYIYYSKLLL